MADRAVVVESVDIDEAAETRLMELVLLARNLACTMGPAAIRVWEDLLAGDEGKMAAGIGRLQDLHDELGGVLDFLYLGVQLGAIGDPLAAESAA